MIGFALQVESWLNFVICSCKVFNMFNPPQPPTHVHALQVVLMLISADSSWWPSPGTLKQIWHRENKLVMMFMRDQTLGKNNFMFFLHLCCAAVAICVNRCMPCAAHVM